ncbi:MAG: YceI family protein [Candidatus Moranbacteria bacterium]|nr:YceI family protein [Candidatus Moranbacteria bacterium]
METKKIAASELKGWLDAKKDFLLVDVMNPEYFAEKHIAGSVNAPVYEVAFLTYLEKLDVPKDKTIVVYNEKESSLAVADAGNKLVRAGFADVYEFPGGLEKWEQAGFPLENGESVAALAVVDGEYILDKENSIVGWSGRNAKYAHKGKIAVKSGNVVVKNAKVVSGKIVLDMTTIKDEDLTDDMWRGVLESHLKSSDFFDVEQYPEAFFEFDQADLIKDALGGVPNYKLNGKLTIKDVTKPFGISAMIVPMGDGVLNGQTHFDFDRTLWNVRYGSEKFFEKLGMHLVNDIVSLEIFLVAKK